MASNGLFIAVVLLAFCICATLSNTSWWSLGVTDGISEEIGAPVSCDSLQDELSTNQQRTFCANNKKIINLIALGARKAIVACQLEFSNWRWNCTTFNGNHLFGSFVENSTKETAVIDSIISAMGAREIGEACRNEDLDNCTCITSGVNQFTNKTFFSYDCAFDGATAQRIMLDFTRSSSATDNTSVVAEHNHRIGTNIVKNTMVTKCRCYGFSGSCSAQQCYFAPLDKESVSQAVREKYGGSVKVRVENSTSVVPVETNSYNNETDLVHMTDSPSFCTTDSAKGILGTTGRPCVRDQTSVNSCDVLCCQRGYNTHTETKPIECCSFVFCCRIECNVCGQNTTTTYTCK